MQCCCGTVRYKSNCRVSNTLVWPRAVCVCVCVPKRKCISDEREEFKQQGFQLIGFVAGGMRHLSSFTLKEGGNAATRINVRHVTEIHHCLSS